MELVSKTLTQYPLVTAFAIVGIVMWLAYAVAKLTKNRIHGSAIAIIFGLVLAYIGGTATGGAKGVTTIPLFSGFTLLGGAMLRDFAIVSTAFGVKIGEFKQAGLSGIVALFVSIALSLIVGAGAAYAFGYTSPVDMATIGGGAATFIVGPVTGTALGASSEVIALSVAAGVVKSIAVMVMTPLLARMAGINSPVTAAVFGGLMGTSSGVVAGLAATDPKLVPYGAFIAAFYTGLGCLLIPSVGYLALNALFG